MTASEPTPDASARRVLDAAALKALAHPLRVEMVDQLTLFGPATASQLADRLAESSGATSYHLRQLARHGLVRELEGRGTARERYWEIVPGGMSITLSEDADPASIEAGKLIARQWAEQRSRQVDAFLRRADVELGDTWVDGSLLLSSRLDLTPEELREVSEEIAATIERLRERFVDLGKREGTRTVSLQANVFPLIDVPGEGK